MQLLLWHEALGSDDEQASEEELTARVLYSLDSSDELLPVGGGGWEAAASAERLLQSLHFVQGLLAFVRLLRRSRAAAQAPPAWTQEWISVTLSRRRFFVLEVEPLIFLALKDHRHAYEALLRDVYRLFRLFHGSIDRNLRLLPSVSSRSVATATSDEKETESVPPHMKTHVDGMELLLDIQTTRKRLRKLRLAIDAHTQNRPLDSSFQDDERRDAVVGRLEVEQQAVEAELQALIAQSPAPHLHKKCANFFPTLLQALDVGGASSFSELQGLGYFPMDQPLFLALQSFVNNLHTELKSTEAGAEIAETSALFFKGNLLWSSMEISMMHLLYKFLRLREERGMELGGCGNQQRERAGVRPPAATERNNALWMEDAYEDTFLPVWSSKLSYTECAAVSQAENGRLHPRRAARSLHKQSPVSLSTFLAESTSSLGGIAKAGSSARVAAAVSTAAGSSPSVSAADSAFSSGSQRIATGGDHARSKGAIKARASSVSFRNAGLLLQNGCFAKPSQLHQARTSSSASRGADGVWSPLVFPLGDVDASSEARATAATTEAGARRRVVVWHEADLTMVLILWSASTHQDLTGSAPEGPTMAILQRLEAHLDKQQQFLMLAQRIFTRYHATFAPDMRYVGALHPLPPFLYLNRVNLAFKMQHVPRLLKSKEDELFPLPTRLLPHYLPASTLALVNELHAELQAAASAGNRELCVRTRHAGWALAKKSQTSRRELYVLFEPKVSSVQDLSGVRLFLSLRTPNAIRNLYHVLSSPIAFVKRSPPSIRSIRRPPLAAAALSAAAPPAALPAAALPAMGKIIDSVLSAYRAPEDGRPTISFEFFPAKTNAGVFNLLTRVEEMGLALQPTFVTLTWRSAFTDEQLWLRIGAHIQNEFQLDVLLHLTCHLPTQQLKQILHKARAAGIRNILALRGDPPIGADRWTPVEGGLSNAVDLIRLIRQEHGDYFCVACAGYAEVHTEAWNHPELPPSNEARALDLQRLRAKQDAGADFIITQFFFDVDNMIQWIADCKAAGISIPILPGYLPIQNYSSFCKFTSWCKTRVPADVLSALDAIKNDDAAVRRYGTQLAVDTCRRLVAAGVRSLHFYTMNLAATVTQVMEGLELLPARNQRDLPWQSTLQRSAAEGEQVRPIFWSNRQASYIARTAAWDEFPNGRWGDRTSPAYGDLSEYYLAFKRPKLKRADLWGTPQSEQDVWDVFVRFIDGHVKQLPWCEQALSLESAAIRENLQWLNANGFLTINSQPRVNGAPSSDPSVGWGGADGVVFQKAYVELFVAPEKLAHLVTVMRRDYPQLSFHALNRRGDEHRNTPLHSVTAVTWGVFPGTEIVQPTVVDSDSFAAWKDEAFELWQTQWASAYPADSQAREVIQHIHDSYFLVNIVDNDYANDDADIFSIFTRIVTEAMDKEHLRARVLQLEARREKMFETLASFQALQEELGGELRAAHSELASARSTNLQLKEKVRQLQAQLALATL
ncbi:hypothetical protein BBJ28_00021425 [Nothophytophthora sp. Chile5]|nr:hypothetical protein BBJ28_00021425 [Nothophytophthora sp. Chile5]